MLKSCAVSCAALASSIQIPGSFYDISERDINDNQIDFSSLAGKVVYVVNVASACG
jgi:hypothetical protein